VSKKDKTPYKVIEDARQDDEIVFTVRARRSDLHFNSFYAVSAAANQIVSAEVIRPLQVGDTVRHKERVSGNNRTRLIRATTEIDGVLFAGFRSFNTREDVFDPADEGNNYLVFAPASEYERVEE
jgi:hypothetical protein